MNHEERRTRSAFEILGSAATAKELEYLVGRISHEKLTLEQEALLIKYRPALISGELSIDAQYALAHRLET